MHVFVACQTDFVNKQFVSPLSWNNPLSETSLRELYILTIYRHLDAKQKAPWMLREFITCNFM